MGLSAQGVVRHVDLTSDQIPPLVIGEGDTLSYCFDGVPETATDPLGEVTFLNWLVAGYVLGDVCSVAGKGKAYYSVLDAYGNVQAGLDKQPCQVNAADATGIGLFMEVQSPGLAPQEYEIVLFVDTTASTTLPPTQQFKRQWSGVLRVKPQREAY